MSFAELSRGTQKYNLLHPGLIWLALATAAATIFFLPGLQELGRAWQLPEYSHGPLIPILSGFLFLRHLKEVPVDPGPKTDRWPGVAVIFLALFMGGLGRLANIPDIVAYATIVWVGGLLLISFGARTGWLFWPSVLHLVYMLPLPGVLYYGLSTSLQMISSELGVWFLKLLSVPVFLEGNIIDLGVYKLHVAEACSGLRYLFPILSFSYIFAVLYRGPMWHKAVLLISAAPITVLMNSVRIAISGVIVDRYGLDWVEGFSHFFEGWVIFVSCVILLFCLARLMLFLQPVKMSLTEALDLDYDGLGTQAKRIALVRPSPALITAAIVFLVGAFVAVATPERQAVIPERESFATFPQRVGDWQQVGPAQRLEDSVATILAADDYHSINLSNAGAAAQVGLFMTWYANQDDGGSHSPEVCLPGAGWEIAWLEQTDISNEIGAARPVELNRAIIQQGESRMMVYYWFEQQGRMLTDDFSAALYTLWDRTFTGRTDTGLVRLTTPILENETPQDAERRLNDATEALLPLVPRYLPDQDNDT
ncbi:VPLPA-CTERM-specific exosortase XrtD [Palleronia sp. LCG004]|uniref:VPLPA-CTERM-specific exosortase XrtD n=1 Tax=Palleronia sp. LCG004 TaxID=3079304 RepID=UPI002943F7B8|nr:VPLPA-CTERM-specific exosortase XrtD [Palleronia sp. LCG004]WOI58406.1 VPLPA-CTERM-specific exosortase XrtD [Palleronia sp. LCG004]